MKQTGLLFQPDMARANVEGRKTMTRRLVKNQAQPWNLCAGCEMESSPYGKRGDLIYQKETWAPYLGHFNHSVAYKASWDGPGSIPASRSPMNEEKEVWLERWAAKHGEFSSFSRDVFKGWSSSLFMPKWASRFWAEIVSVRVERLQEISEKDARKEGFASREEFFNKIAQIHGKESIERNEWYWAIEYKQIDRATRRADE